MMNCNLDESERIALNELIEYVRSEWPQSVLKIFGSKITGTSDEESDIDVLIILPVLITERIRRKIIYKVFEINLEYESNISPLIVSRSEWETGHMTVLPIHETIESQGVPL